MKTQVTATFVDGMFKPDEPVELPNHARVQVTIEPVVEQAASVAAWQALKRRIAQRPVHSGGRHFTRDELHERG